MSAKERREYVYGLFVSVLALTQVWVPTEIVDHQRALLVSSTGPDRNDTMDIFVCALWYEADVALADVGECRTGPSRRGRRTR